MNSLELDASYFYLTYARCVYRGMKFFAFSLEKALCLSSSHNLKSFSLFLQSLHKLKTEDNSLIQATPKITNPRIHKV